MIQPQRVLFGNRWLKEEDLDDMGTPAPSLEGQKVTETTTTTTTTTSPEVAPSEDAPEDDKSSDNADSKEQ